MTSLRLLACILLASTACVAPRANTAPASPDPFQSTSLFDDDEDESSIPTTETSPFAETSSTVTPTPEPQPDPPAPTTAPSNEPTTDRLAPP